MSAIFGRARSILTKYRTVTKSPPKHEPEPEPEPDLQDEEQSEDTATEANVKRLSDLSNPSTLTSRGRKIRDSLLSVYDMRDPEIGVQAALALIADAENTPLEDEEETDELELLKNWADELCRDIDWLAKNGDPEFKIASDAAMKIRKEKKEAEEKAKREKRAAAAAATHALAAQIMAGGPQGIQATSRAQ